MFAKKYKQAIDRHEQFWERTNTDRPILNISYKKEGFVPYPTPKTPEQKFLDIDYKYNAYKHNAENMGYLAEGVPLLFTNLGPGCLAESLGSGYKLTDRSVWFDVNTPVKDWDNPPKVEFDPKSELWTVMEKEQKLYASDPDVHFSITDIGGIMDVVASLRGTQNLLYDLYDYPDEVREFTKQVKKEWFKAFDQQLKTVTSVDQPINNWMNIPSKKPWFPIQCDFCFMISPTQFEEFVLEDIIDQANYMERSIYHLDGIGELPHVDMLLDIENLGGIQWVPGDNTESVTDPKWLDLYKKIQDKNKCLVLTNCIDENDFEGLERIVKTLDPRGVHLRINCSTKDKAEDLVEKITRWSE